MRYPLFLLGLLLLPPITGTAQAEPSVSNVHTEIQASRSTVSNRLSVFDRVHLKQKSTEEIETDRFAGAATSNILSEIQEAWNVVSNRQSVLCTLGLKYKDSKEVKVAGSAHAALIGANDFGELSNLVARLRGAYERKLEFERAVDDVITQAHKDGDFSNLSSRLRGLREEDPYEADRVRSVVFLYAQHASVPCVRTVFSNELTELYTEQTMQTCNEYRRAMLLLMLDHASDLVLDAWLQNEIDALLKDIVDDRGQLPRNTLMIGKVLRILAERGDPTTPDVITRVRQLNDKELNRSCSSAEWMYRMVTATQPEEVVKKAILSGDEALEQWCIFFIDKKRLTALLPYVEERGKASPPMLKSLYRQLTVDLRDPEQKAQLGSDANPIVLPEELAPRQPQGTNTSK